MPTLALRMRALGLFAAALAAAGRLRAGAIAGTVRDDSGGALPGVTVEVSGPALSSARVAATDEVGAYRVEGLPAGNYDVVFRLLERDPVGDQH
ncbi:MAG TPA: carboxypeptidase-like regulatory domain-containing protein, partial [Thermoanaerobaculia bacterium]|nr:carboxypeptidase-like regulatory domain-containing protein [Thermoanaerobaculia bacterium]